MRTSERSPDLIAEIKFAILQQRELAARLMRGGDSAGAREARAKLFALEDKLEVLEDMVRPWHEDTTRAD